MKHKPPERCERLAPVSHLQYETFGFLARSNKSRACPLIAWLVTVHAAISSTFAQQAIDENCTVTVSGLSARVLGLGASGAGGAAGGAGSACGSSTGSASFSVPNIPANGQPVRAEATCNRPGLTLFGASDFVDIVVGGSICASGMRMNTSPPASVIGVGVAGASSINLSATSTAQLSVTGNMTSSGFGLGAFTAREAMLAIAARGETEFEENLTLRSKGTAYRSSNPAIASVDINGLVTAYAPGTVYITITNRGATTVKKIIVGHDFTSTTIEGFVQLSNGTGVDDAIVRATLGVETATSSNGTSPGYFSMNLTDIPVGDPITLQVLADTGTEAYVEQLAVIPVPSGITDAGIIILNDVFDPFTDAIAREFAVYNNTYIDIMNDAIAREFSVYNEP